MSDVSTVHTADLSTEQRHEIRRLLDVAFEEDFADEDWEHALGGLHFLIERDAAIVAHVAVVQRHFLLDERSWRVGYVEALAVSPAWQRQGLAGAVMTAAERVIDHAYDFGALSASDAGRALYLGRGWQPWQGATWVMSPDGLVRTADEDESTLVRGTGVRVDGDLACDWRNGDVW